MICIKELFEWLKHSDEHPLIQSCVFHYEFKLPLHKALEASCSLGESTPFIEFMLDIILKSIKSSVKNSVNTEDKILTLLNQDSTLTLKILSEKLDLTQRAVEKQIAKLKSENRLQRVGSARNGYWEIYR